MRRILLGLLFALSVSLVSLVVTLSGSLIASGTGDQVAVVVLRKVRRFMVVKSVRARG